MRRHLPDEVWRVVIARIEELDQPVAKILRELGLSTSTYYRKKKELTRKKGSGRPKKWCTAIWVLEAKKILDDLPPDSGHRSAYRMLKRKHVVVPSRATLGRMLARAGMSVAPLKGRSKKKIPKVETEYSNELWMADTTEYWAGRDKANIYMSIDAFDRRCTAIGASITKTAPDTIAFFDPIFDEEKPERFLTDGGGEFSALDARAFCEARGVAWNPVPTHTPEARHYIERLNETLKSWLDWKDPQDFFDLSGLLGEFKQWYNFERPHSSLDDLTPVEFYEKCKQLTPV